MLALRLLRRRREEQPVNLKYLAWVAVAILAVFLFLRFFDWIDDTKRSLLPQTPALAILDDLSSLENIVPLPAQTFGAELSIAGLYTGTEGEFPEGTVVVVYVKDDPDVVSRGSDPSEAGRRSWRFVEIDYFPDITSTEFLATHIYPTQEIKLDQERSVWIQTIDDNPRCIDYEDSVPNRCEISRHLIADLDGRLLLIAADGNHPTDGELIELARSILSVDDQDSR
ncbi:MAG: hypothetical protein NUV84_01900 [Candidatus Uhrbacteria bacterium]|nr:hypothetical protein [Candidatus Uhrbacteria bacterium]